MTYIEILYRCCASKAKRVSSCDAIARNPRLAPGPSTHIPIHDINIDINTSIHAYYSAHDTLWWQAAGSVIFTFVLP
jgi:hypothetical protein